MCCLLNAAIDVAISDLNVRTSDTFAPLMLFDIAPQSCFEYTLGSIPCCFQLPMPSLTTNRQSETKRLSSLLDLSGIIVEWKSVW